MRVTPTITKPSLIVIGGFAGSGKTTIAKRLSTEMRCPLFSSDDFIHALKSAATQNVAAASIAMDILWMTVDAQLKNNVSVIVDANMCHQQSWDSIDELMKRNGAVRCVPIILECSLEICTKRINERGTDDPRYSDLKKDMLHAHLSKHEFLLHFQRDGLIRINAERPQAEVYSDVLTALEVHLKF